MIKQTDMGEGVMKTEMLNADGTVASSFLEGSVRLPSGQVMRNVEVSGSSLSDWDAFQEIAAKTGGLFDGKKSAAAGAFSASSKSSSSSGSKPKAPTGYMGSPLAEEAPSQGAGGTDEFSQMLMALLLPILGGSMGGASSGPLAGSYGAPGPSSAPPGYDTAPSSASRSSARRSGPPTTSMPDPMMY